VVTAGERSRAAGLDPRAKLAVQAGAGLFVVAAPRTGLAAVAALAVVACAAARVDPLGALWRARALAPLLLAAPVVAALSPAPPHLVAADARAPALAAARVPPLYLLGAAYAASTTPRESRAAVAWLVPGRTGALLGAGVEATFRLLPRLRADLAALRRGADARLVARRGPVGHVRVVAVGGLRRTLRRADALARALRARAFSTNPTLPPLALGPADAVVLALAAGLVLATGHAVA
jgi:biotin transport system permease protein